MSACLKINNYITKVDFRSPWIHMMLCEEYVSLKNSTYSFMKVSNFKIMPFQWEISHIINVFKWKGYEIVFGKNGSATIALFRSITYKCITTKFSVEMSFFLREPLPEEMSMEAILRFWQFPLDSWQPNFKMEVTQSWVRSLS